MQSCSHHELNEGAIALAVSSERLRVFNERAMTGALSAFAGIALLSWVLWVSAGLTPALTWALLITAGEAAIFLVGMRCRKALESHGDSQACKNTHFVLAGLCGMVWGSAVWFVWREGDVLSYLATMTILVGVAGVSMVTMSSYAKAALLFFAGMYLVPLLHVVQFAGPLTNIMVVGLVAGLAVQLAYTRSLGLVVLRDAEHHARNAALVERLNDLVIHDQLTGAYSRRHTLEQMETLVSTRLRHGTSASLIMFDLDHFKAINDTYGHPAGDRALREAVRAVGAQLRDGDLLGRVGGEEFLVLLPMTEMAAALQLAERLRQTLATTSIADGANTVLLPASFAVAELKPAENHAEWFRRVDGALYQAKQQGRNTVVAAS